MELVANFPQFEQDVSTRRAKSRSKACLHCRRRKMKCDGVKPSCFQCVRAERANECEYDDGITKTSTQMLYERLAMLEKRYRDLRAAKRFSQNRRTPSYSRAHPSSSMNSTGSSDTNLVRSNSAPGGVYSQPRVTGNSNGPYGQGLSEAFMSVDDASRSFTMTELGPSLTRSPFMTADKVDKIQSQQQPFDLISSSLSSHSSSHSGRSTPSTSDLSHNDIHFHPKYASMSDLQQQHGFPGDQSPFVYHEVNMRDVNQRELSIPREFQVYQSTKRNRQDLNNPFQDLPGLPQVPRKLSQSYIFDAVGEISPSLLEHLIDNFVAHSQQVGITLLNNRILDILCMTAPHVSPTLSCCLNVLLLWGARFSNFEAVRSLQGRLLQGVLATLPSLLSSPLQVPPEFEALHNQEGETDGRFNVLFAATISVAVATYLFTEGRTIEGTYHANTATQLAICAGLHRTPDPALWRDWSNLASRSETYAESLDPKTLSGFREVTPDPKVVCALRSSTDLIPPPNNLTAALERHQLFWNIFVLDRTWSAGGRLLAPSSRWCVSAGDPTRMGDPLVDRDLRTSITTSWPEDWCLLLLEDPQDIPSSSPKSPSRSPLEEFLSGADVSPTRSILQLRAKSVALFELASRIASCKDPERRGTGRDAWVSLQGTIVTFLKTLPPLPSQDFRISSYAKSAPYMIHTLAHAANIRLYSRLSEKAYNERLIDDPTAVFRRGRTNTGVERVIEGLLGYERVFSLQQEGLGCDNTTDPWQSAHSPGEFVAAVDHCLCSAREMVRIASCLTPDDISFLEPITAPCWALASEVLLCELRRLCAAHQMPETTVTNLLTEINVLETSLKYLGTFFPIGNIEARKITSALANITTDNISGAA